MVRAELIEIREFHFEVHPQWFHIILALVIQSFVILFIKQHLFSLLYRCIPPHIYCSIIDRCIATESRPLQVIRGTAEL